MAIKIMTTLDIQGKAAEYVEQESKRTGKTYPEVVEDAIKEVAARRASGRLDPSRDSG